MTVNGAVPVTVDGATIPLPVKAATGAVPPPPPDPEAVIPDFTGKTAEAETGMLPPTMFDMTGVITLNVHVRLTSAVSPIPYVPSPSASVKVGSAATSVPPTFGRWQF